MERKLEQKIIDTRDIKVFGIVFDGQVGSQSEPAVSGYPYLSIGTYDGNDYVPFDGLPNGKVFFEYIPSLTVE